MGHTCLCPSVPMLSPALLSLRNSALAAWTSGAVFVLKIKARSFPTSCSKAVCPGISVVMEGGERALCLPCKQSPSSSFGISPGSISHRTVRTLQQLLTANPTPLATSKAEDRARLPPVLMLLVGGLLRGGEAGVLLLCSVSLVAVPCVVHSCQCSAVCLPSLCCCVLWVSAGTLIYELPAAAICAQLVVLSFPSPVCFPGCWNGTAPIKPVFVFSQVSSVHTARVFGVFQRYGCLISKEMMFGKYCVCGSGCCCEEN